MGHWMRLTPVLLSNANVLGIPYKNAEKNIGEWTQKILQLKLFEFDVLQLNRKE